MVHDHYHPFAASHHHAPHNAQRLNRLDAQEPVTLSLYVKPREHAAEPDLLAARAAAHAPDIATIAAFAAAHGLVVLEADARRRLIRLSGSAASMRTAFGADLRIGAGFGYAAGRVIAIAADDAGSERRSVFAAPNRGVLWHSDQPDRCR
ncbi:MAG: hypothetical protein B7X48_00875 [Acidiphilium sp. 34-60-192]|nr:MAG: hypothetical protein B7X48_00875 [Acidiphilium sp. 34-60-192]